MTLLVVICCPQWTPIAILMSKSFVSRAEKVEREFWFHEFLLTQKLASNIFQIRNGIPNEKWQIVGGLTLKIFIKMFLEKNPWKHTGSEIKIKIWFYDPDPVISIKTCETTPRLADVGKNVGHLIGIRFLIIIKTGNEFFLEQLRIIDLHLLDKFSASLVQQMFDFTGKCCWSMPLQQDVCLLQTNKMPLIIIFRLDPKILDITKHQLYS